MTHTTDCEVQEAYRDEVTRLAKMVYDGEFDEAKRIAKNEYDWEYIGGGMGRRVFRVADPYQTEDEGIATFSGPCVVKMPVKSRFDGKRQNREEVTQFEMFPDDLTHPGHGEIPPVVPVKDWHPDYWWLSMPEVDAGGGHARGVEDKLHSFGWECEDLHHDNVGEMHGHPVALDYGLECYEVAVAADLANEFVTDLESIGCVNVDWSETHSGATVMFETPPDLLDAPDNDQGSAASISTDAGVYDMNVVFGRWPEFPDGFGDGHWLEGLDTEQPMLDPAAEMAADKLNENWGALIEPDVMKEDGDWYVSFRISQMGYGGDQVHPDVASDVVSDLFQAVEEFLPGGEKWPADPTKIEGGPLDPEVGQVLDHPDFSREVYVTEVKDNGDVIVEDFAGFEQNLMLRGYTRPTENMVVAKRSKEQMTIDQAVERALDEGSSGESTNDILRDIEREVEDAVGI